MFIKAILTFGVVFATLTYAPEQIDLTGIKCVVEGDRNAVGSATADYKDGKIYLCCDRCARTFSKDAELAEDAKFATKANHQLVLTGQYVQKFCPVSGNALDENFGLTVGAVEIGFSGADCQAKIEQLKTIEEKVALLFSDSTFDKAFGLKVVEVNLTDVKPMMPEKSVAVNQAVENTKNVKNTKTASRVQTKF